MRFLESPLEACKSFGCLLLKVEEVILESHDAELAVCLKPEDGEGATSVPRIRSFEELVF